MRVLVLAGIKERWRPLRAELLPRVVLLDFTDPQRLVGQGFRNRKPQKPIWSAAVPARTLRDGMPIAADALGDFVGDLLLEHDASDASLVVALPRQACEWRLITWPGGFSPEDPIEALRELNPDLTLPYPLGAASIDVQPVPGREGSAVVVAAPRTTVEAWIDLFAIAGSSLRHLLPSQACQMLALREQLEAMAPGELLSVLQPTSTECLLDVWLDGAPHFQRRLPLEAPQLVPALQRCLQFCRDQFGTTHDRLLVSDELGASIAVEQVTGLKLEPVDRRGFGSLVLAGLAEAELDR